MNNHDVEQIILAAEILEDNLQDPPTIAVLARKLGINQQKLKCNFKYFHQITIRQYVLKKRLAMGKELLENNQKMSISAVSETIGYNNASYFARRFQEKYGLLPNEVRSKQGASLDFAQDKFSDFS